jgi:hypothetical protein
VYFIPICGDGKPNTANPPCTNLNDASLVPEISVSVQQYSFDPKSTYPYEPNENQYVLSTEPLVFPLANSQIYCTNTSGANNTVSVVCLTKVITKEALSSC